MDNFFEDEACAAVVGEGANGETVVGEESGISEDRMAGREVAKYTSEGGMVVGEEMSVSESDLELGEEERANGSEQDAEKERGAGGSEMVDLHEVAFGGNSADAVAREGDNESELNVGDEVVFSGVELNAEEKEGNEMAVYNELGATGGCGSGCGLDVVVNEGAEVGGEVEAGRRAVDVSDDVDLQYQLLMEGLRTFTGSDDEDFFVKAIAELKIDPAAMCGIMKAILDINYPGFVLDSSAVMIAQLYTEDMISGIFRTYGSNVNFPAAFRRFSIQNQQRLGQERNNENVNGEGMDINDK